MKQETLKTLEKLLTGLVVMDFKKEAEKKIHTCLKEVKEAINYNRFYTQLPDKLEPVLAKIQHINSLGKSNWYEVVYNDGNWRSYQGSKTFEDGEKVVKWNYCNAIV